MSFKVGDEIVCIENFDIKESFVDVPIKEHIYIVTATKSKYGHKCVMLEGMNCFGRGYTYTSFRKLDDIKLQQELAQKATQITKETLDVPLKEEELELT